MDDLPEEHSLAGQRELLSKFPPDWTIQQIAYEQMDSAEALAIACKTRIVPLKNFDYDLMRKGRYLGTNPLIDGLLGYKTEIKYPDPNKPSGERRIEVPRWAFVQVPDYQRPKFMDHVARQFKEHGTARVRTKW